MTWQSIPVLVVLALAATQPHTSTAKGPDLIGTTEAFRVVSTERGGETLVPADKASPQDVIEYRLTYKNDGAGPVQNVAISDPVPAGTRYVARSAKLSGRGRVEFSIDGGKAFHEWPVPLVQKTPDGREVVTQAPPDMVTHIRWVVDGAFPSRNEITASYRTTIR